ncbi:MULTISPECIES: hypothetical protein [unclassified Streptomyces]|uniref:hypothetical protein n=1 Tax=unclassified Streptomyces TaxID=2593676 RepID=UPI00225697E5|nr:MULTISPECIES: hypothetical protein [unclassified Streptomyces]MCX4527005.1 hypothetical protein [Streptomyces sp. NBC_01551]MCX4542435.1 hypothetical protein [Streptomyces sp. NBC_01565]
MEVHCHGFGDVDFSDFTKVDLERLDAWCAREGVLSLPTMYLHRAQLGEFEAFVRDYDRMRSEGGLRHIAGIALEGPLLASHGGTPASTVWAPSRAEWERLAALGEFGLKYTVLSPDAFSPASELHDAPGARETGFEWLVPLLMAHGIRPALGHFTRADPARSAAQVDEIVELAWQSQWAGAGARVVTDHLFNDMPLTIRHAFRTTRARKERDEIIASYDLPNWTLRGMADIAGPVPAAIMRQAAAGRIAACINFDGEHVDLAIAARAVQLMGVENSMMMTDRCDSARLGGQDLHQTSDNGLWYQDAGVVAAGSVPLARQMANARSQGLSDEDVHALVAATAHRVFGLSVGADLRVSAA